MHTATREWNDGRECWYVTNEAREWVNTFNTREEAIAAVGECQFIDTPEPRFIVRDHSGRGWCVETLYTSFTAEERAYVDEEGDEFAQTFGEWLDSSDAGDEFNNSDERYEVIRIN